MTIRLCFSLFGMAPLVLTVHLHSSLHRILFGHSGAFLLWLCEVFDEGLEDKFLHKMNEVDFFRPAVKQMSSREFYLEVHEFNSLNIKISDV